MFYVGCLCLLFAPLVLANHILRLTLWNCLFGILGALACLTLGVMILSGLHEGPTTDAEHFYGLYCVAAIVLVTTAKVVSAVWSRAD